MYHSKQNKESKEKIMKWRVKLCRNYKLEIEQNLPMKLNIKSHKKVEWWEALFGNEFEI